MFMLKKPVICLIFKKVKGSENYHIGKFNQNFLLRNEQATPPSRSIMEFTMHILEPYSLRNNNNGIYDTYSNRNSKTVQFKKS